MGLASDEDSQVLEANPDFTRIADHAHVCCRRLVDERLDSSWRGDCIGGVDDREGRSRQAARTDEPLPDRQRTAAEAVLAVQPIDDLMDEPARQRHLVQRPALHPGMDVQRTRIGDAGWQTTSVIEAPASWRNGRPSESRYKKTSSLPVCIAHR